MCKQGEKLTICSSFNMIAVYKKQYSVKDLIYEASKNFVAFFISNLLSKEIFINALKYKKCPVVHDQLYA